MKKLLVSAVLAGAGLIPAASFASAAPGGYATTATTSTAKVTTTTATTTTTHTYAVVAGVYTKHSAAAAKLTKLSKLGFTKFLIVSKGTHYDVQEGPVTASQAAKLASSLKSHGIGSWTYRVK